MDKAYLTLIDGTQKSSGTRFYVDEVTAVNFDAQIAAVDALDTAVAAITETGYRRSGITHNVVDGDPSLAAGLRNLKWLVKWTAGSDPIEHGTHEVPCADMSHAVVQGDKWLLDPDSGEYTDLVSAFESVVKTETGLSVTVQSVELTGRTI
jgi:hypothetical protein